MPRPPLGRDETLRILEETPWSIAAATANVPASLLRSARVLGEWTATDVLAHLRCCDDAGAGMIERIIASPGERLESIDPRRRLDESGYRELEFRRSLRAFVRHRAKLVKLLRSLPVEAWRTSAIVIDRRGRRERSVVDYTDWLARHEPRHMADFARAASRISAKGRRSS